MRTTAIAILIVLALTLVWGAVVVSVAQTREKVYDCTVAEFHPDYPPKVRQACREIMKERKVNWI